MDVKPESREQRRGVPANVDVSRLLAWLRRSPRERLEHAVQVARALERLRNARRLGPLLRR